MQISVVIVLIILCIIIFYGKLPKTIMYGILFAVIVYIIYMYISESPGRNVNYHGPTKKFDIRTAKQIGDSLHVDWEQTPLKWWRKGMNVELEHGYKSGSLANITNDNPLMTGKIALAHIMEFPDYYQRLHKMEKEAEEFWAKNSLVKE